MKRHQEFKKTLKDVSGYKTTYSQLSLSQTLKIMRKAKRLFGDMNMIEYHELVEKFPNLGKGSDFGSDLPF